MAFLDDLQKATQLFNQGMTKLATTNAFNKANQQLAQLNQTAISEAEKAAEMNKLSQGLAQDLLQAGASTGQVQQAFQAFSPVKPQTGEELIARGAVEQGQDLQRDQTQVAQERKLELLQAKQLLASQKKDKKKTVPVGQLEKIQEADVAKQQASEILGTLDTLATDIGTGKGRAKTVQELLPKVEPEGGGGVVGLVSGIADPFGLRTRVSPEFGDFDARLERMFQQYRVAVTGAQASEKELKQLRPLIPRTTDNPEVFRKKMNTIIKELNQEKTKRLSNLGRAGFDISGFKENTVSELAQQQQVLKLSPQQRQAAEWAKQNPDDPRAQKIMEVIKRANK